MAYLGCEHQWRSGSTPRAVRWALTHGVSWCNLSNPGRVLYCVGMVMVMTRGRNNILWQPMCIPYLVPMPSSFSSYRSSCSRYYLSLSATGVAHPATLKLSLPGLSLCKVNCSHQQQHELMCAPHPPVKQSNLVHWDPSLSHLLTTLSNVLKTFKDLIHHHTVLLLPSDPRVPPEHKFKTKQKPKPKVKH